MHIFIPVIILITLTCFLLFITKKSGKNKTLRKKILINILAPVTGGNEKCASEIYSLLRAACDKPVLKDKLFALLSKYALNGADINFYSVLLCDVYEIRD